VEGTLIHLAATRRAAGYPALEPMWLWASVPFTVTLPEVGASSPMIIRIVVDFPAPFGHSNPVMTPGWTVKVKSSTASLPPCRLEEAY
jgi:hypothetical protein